MSVCVSKIHRSVWFIVGVLALPAWGSGSGDWPGWRGPDSNGVVLADEALVVSEGQGLKIVWKRTLGSGYSSVCVVGDQAITLFSDGTHDFAGAFDAKTGAELWRTQIAPTYKGHDGSHDGPLSTPLIDGDQVFILGPRGQLSALNRADGKVLWTVHLEQELQARPPFYGFTTSPIVWQDLLIVETGAEDAAISAFDKKTGEKVWSAASDVVNYQSPALVTLLGKPQVLFAGNDFVCGIDPKTGTELWQYPHHFESNSMNPMVLGEDGVFLNSVTRETALLKISSGENGYQAQEVWRSRELAGSHNPPVEKDGYLYGYSRRFLACVDAKTGALAWKSRPPGDGFLIRVNGYLVIMNLRGSLHLVDASSDGYHEVANLPVFDDVCWTPPSFAHTKIYVRNIKEMACLEIADVAQPLARIQGRGPSLKVPRSTFAAFVGETEQAENKTARIDAFMQAQKQFPIIEGNTTAHIVFRGPAKDLTLVGDMIDTNTEAPMNHIDGTDFYYASFELPSNARLNYNFTKDFEERIPDPLNPVIVPSFFGDRSQLAMPDFVPATHWHDPESGPRGSLEPFAFDSKILNNQRNITVYLPPGYEPESHRYPTLYVNYGTQAIEFAKIPNTLDNLIGKTIEPVIAVFIDAPNSAQEYARTQRDQFAQMITGELIPFIDAKYATRADAGSRAFMGGDEGGYAAIYTTFKFPGSFGMAAGQSTHLLPGHGGEEIIAVVENSAPEKRILYLDWGRFDYRNAAGGYSWITLNENFVALLKRKGYQVAGGETAQGWGWASWRENTDKILERFFPLTQP